MFDWQTISALTIVAVAVIYVLGKFIKPSGSSSTCGGCSKCPANTTTKIYQLK